jgi:MFS family permease
MKNPFQLLREQRFRPFFLTQFLGALNDNIFKTTLITLVAFHATTLTSIDGATLATLLPGLFILPFFLFSAIAGQIADKYEKSQLIRIVKLFEIGIMLFASLGFFLHQFTLLALALFMMGMHSTLFGPVKYAYLPQHLHAHELVGGNGMVEMATFVAILLGQVLGAWLGAQSQHEILTSITVLAIAVFGYTLSRQVPHSPAAARNLTINWNPLSEIKCSFLLIWRQPSVWLAIVAISWFWFYGATLLAQFPNFAKTILHGDESVFILLLSVFSVGVGVGSLLCEKMSKNTIELGLVVFGAIGLSLFGIDLWASCADLTMPASVTGQNYQEFLSVLSHWRILIDIALIGLFGGFYIVPLYVLIQTRVERTYQSRVIAANNMMNALFMVLSAGFSIAVFSLGFSIPQLFLITALLNGCVMLYLCWRQPEFPQAFKRWIQANLQQ